jgi:hypothetical protein
MQFQRPVVVDLPGSFSPAPVGNRGAVRRLGFADNGGLAAGLILWANAA